MAIIIALAAAWGTAMAGLIGLGIRASRRHPDRHAAEEGRGSTMEDPRHLDPRC